MKNTCIIIVGPTAVGKTALAIQLAQQYGTSIISCDSRQCFRELNIGVAKPSAEELAAVPHYFINSHSIQDTVNAATFETFALDAIKTIFSAHNIAVMVGGTGLYVKAFCEGLDEVPPTDAAIREEIIHSYEHNGIAWLQQRIEQEDDFFFRSGEIQNPQRMMRALEVKRSTGKSILDFYSPVKKQRDFNIITIGLELPRQVLTERINQRVEVMMKCGLLEEVRSLVPYQQLNALQTVGYKELFAYLNGNCTLEAAVEAIKINTRQYAKRQMTWFKKDNSIQWCEPDLQSVAAALHV